MMELTERQKALLQKAVATQIRINNDGLRRLDRALWYADGRQPKEEVEKLEAAKAKRQQALAEYQELQDLLN